jgi:hypothetical protein
MVLGKRRRVNREQRQEVVLLQCRVDRPLCQFKGNRDRTNEALLLRLCPFVNARDPASDAAEFAPDVASGLQADAMFGICLSMPTYAVNCWQDTNVVFCSSWQAGSSLRDHGSQPCATLQW